MPETSSNTSDEPNESKLGGTIKAIVTTIIGLTLLLFGLGAVIPDEAGTNSSMLALGALFAALGAGLLASVLLPHKIEVSGEKIQPLGVDVKASGGAAVFLIALAFIYFSNAQSIEASQNAGNGGETMAEVEPDASNTSTGENGTADAGNQTANDEALASEIAEGELPYDEQEFASEWAEPEAAIPLDATPPSSATFVPGPGYLDNPYNDSYSLAPGLVKARTYCSTCCPMGPQVCGQAGGAASYDIIEAGAAAIALCVERQGNPDTCTANVEQF